MASALNITFPGNLAQVDDVPTLRAIPSALLLDETYLVESAGIYNWNPSSLSADDGLGVVKPSDKTLLQAGRWLLIGSGFYLTTAFQTALGASTGAGLVGYAGSSVAAALNNLTSVVRIVPVPTGDAYPVLQSVIDGVGTGGVVQLVPGATYTCSVAPVVSAGVTLDLNGATLVLNLSDRDGYGVRLRNNSTLMNGKIILNSLVNPSLQAAAHSCVAIGPRYGASPTVNNISPDEGVSGWRVRNMDLLNNKLASEGSYEIGGVAIQITGGASNGLIEDIRVPDSNRMFGIVHADWGTVGGINSPDVPGSRAAFNAGTAYTTHPHDITIRKIRGGNLTRAVTVTDTGSDAIRLSGVYNFLVEDVRVETTTYATIRHTGGDLGFEFAPDAAKRMAYQNIVVRDVSCPNTGISGQLIYSDTLADNVQRSIENQGYSAIVPPLALTNMTMERVTGRAAAGVTEAGIGVRVIQQRGGTFADCGSVGHYVGHLAGDLAVDVTFLRPRAMLCRAEGVKLAEYGSAPGPLRCKVVGAFSSLNNRAGLGSANVLIGRSTECTVEGGTIGVESGESAVSGIRIDTATNGCFAASITGNPTILSHASGGAAISVSSDEGWNALRLFTGATYGSAVTTQWAGLSIVPVAIEGRTRRSRANSGKLSSNTTPPSGYPGIAGEVIHFNDPVITTDTTPQYFSKTTCYVSGTPGTWRASA